MPLVVLCIEMSKRQLLHIPAGNESKPDQTCDTVDEMIDWMDTTGKDYGEERSGTSNLVDALDTITWWATYSFFHLDENPVRSAYLEE